MTSDNGRPARRFRSRDWFDDPHRRDQSALYLERFMNYGITPDELRSGRPVVGIAQSGSDLSPCNRHHLQLADRVRDGDRKSTRLNSSHANISYAVFCLKKKNKKDDHATCFEEQI